MLACINERGKGNYIINQSENANREGLDMIWNLAACLHQRLLTFLLDRAPSLEGERGHGWEGKKQLKMQKWVDAICSLEMMLWTREFHWTVRRSTTKRVFLIKHQEYKLDQIS